jgi:glycosyltransferase involved in cell wall biosynthesis
MQNKKVILHIIKDFGRGGAETMLVEVLKELTDFDNIVVTFTDVYRFDDKLNCSKQFSLKINSLFYLPVAIFKFKKIIKQNNVSLVHSHLYWPTFLARLATPAKIPLITTIHNFIAYVPHYKKWYMRFLDRFSYKLRKSVIIGVAEGARIQYFEFLKLKPSTSYCLYTFVNTNVFNNIVVDGKADGNIFKLVTLASLSYQKNHIFLINAFKKLKKENFELHIYGKGELQMELQEAIDKTGARVLLMGETSEINKILPQYDVYVMSSLFEGFSLSVLEAMAMQVPLLLTNIESFREQCADTAIFYEVNNIEDFIEKLKKLQKDAMLRNQIAQAAKQRVLNNYTLDHHMAGLRKIYTTAINTLD